MVTDDASREANQDGRQGRPPRSLYHVPTCHDEPRTFVGHLTVNSFSFRGRLLSTSRRCWSGSPWRGHRTRMRVQIRCPRPNRVCMASISPRPVISTSRPERRFSCAPMSGVCRIEDPRGKEGRRDPLRVVSPRRPRWRVAPGEFHPRAVPEPCLNLSTHTAPDVQPMCGARGRHARGSPGTRQCHWTCSAE